MEKVKFIIKARGDHLDAFRNAFSEMNAIFSENWLDDEKTVMKFDVTCEPDAIVILENKVPISAYASVAFTSNPFS